MNVVTWASTSASVSFCEAATSDAMLARTIIRRETGADVSQSLRSFDHGQADALSMLMTSRPSTSDLVTAFSP